MGLGGTRDRVNSKDRLDRVEQEIGLTARTGGTGWNKSSHGHTPVASKDAYLNSLWGWVGGWGVGFLSKNVLKVSHSSPGCSELLEES